MKTLPNVLKNNHKERNIVLEWFDVKKLLLSGEHQVKMLLQNENEAFFKFFLFLFSFNYSVIIFTNNVK